MYMYININIYIYVYIHIFIHLFTYVHTIPVHRCRPAGLTILDNPMFSIARVITDHPKFGLVI